MINSIRMNMSYMIRRKSTVFTFAVLMIYVLINFFYNMNENIERIYISQMFDLVKTSGLSSYAEYVHFFMEYFPLLVMIPTAYCYLNDKNTNIKIYIESRVGKRNYWYGKLIAVFLVTLLVFIIPFLIELLISCICFDINSLGDPSNIGYEQSIELDSLYPLSNLFIFNRILFCIVWIFIFGIISAILACFNFAVCTLNIFKYKILTFFPLYGLVYFITFADKIFKPSYTLHYPFILEMFELTPKNYTIYGLFLFIILILSIALVEIKVRRNDYK